MKRSIVVIGLVVAPFLMAQSAPSSCDPDVATPNQVALALNAYNTALAAAVAYENSSACHAMTPQAYCQKAYSALVAIRAGRKQLQAQLEANGTVSLSALQALQDGYAVIQAIPKS